MRAVLFILFAIFASSALASPHPAMGSSKVYQEHKRIIRSPLGFELDLRESKWSMHMPSRKDSFIYRVFKGEKVEGSEFTPSLSVRVDNLKKPLSLKAYVKRWIREYPYYGFQILGTRLFKHQNRKGFLIDLENEEAGKKLRQVIFLKQGRAVVMTCSDQTDKFPSTLKECNQIVRSFKWN